jgi:hypothetical protein
MIDHSYLGLGSYGAASLEQVSSTLQQRILSCKTEARRKYVVVIIFPFFSFQMVVSDAILDVPPRHKITMIEPSHLHLSI